MHEGRWDEHNSLLGATSAFVPVVVEYLSTAAGLFLGLIRRNETFLTMPDHVV